jgi:hypothetical protein
MFSVVNFFIAHHCRLQNNKRELRTPPVSLMPVFYNCGGKTLTHSGNAQLGPTFLSGPGIFTVFKVENSFREKRSLFED